jgi:integrase
MPHPLVRSWEFSWAAEGRSPRTMREMRWFVDRFEIVLAAEGRNLQASTRADCEVFIASHESKFRANYAWRSLRSLFGFIAEELEIPNPMEKVRAPKVPLTEVTTASEEDLSRLLRACSPYSSFENARDAAAISLLWATGLRRSELAALRMDDVDLDSQTLVVRKSKTGRSRRVPFDSRALQHLLRYLGRREVYPATSKAPEALWVGKRGPLSSDGLRSVIERRRREAGVTISAHSFRRGMAARALRAGVSGPSTSTLLGWQPGSTMLSRYVRGVAQELAIDEARRLLG